MPRPSVGSSRPVLPGLAVCHHGTETLIDVTALIEPDEDGVFVATCPTLPGCVSQGTTREEARQNIIDAITGYLESLRKHDEPIPPPITEEVAEIDV